MHLDVLLGDYIGTQVAIKVLKDKSMVQQFLAEAYVMTYITVSSLFCHFISHNVHVFKTENCKFCRHRRYALLDLRQEAKLSLG